MILPTERLVDDISRSCRMFTRSTTNIMLNKKNIQNYVFNDTEVCQHQQASTTGKIMSVLSVSLEITLPVELRSWFSSLAFKTICINISSRIQLTADQVYN